MKDRGKAGANVPVQGVLDLEGKCAPNTKKLYVAFSNSEFLGKKTASAKSSKGSKKSATDILISHAKSLNW